HAWLRRLVRLERQITELNVPDCPVPAGLLERVAEPVARPPLIRPPMQPSTELRSVREVGRQKLALATALAAPPVLFTLAWWRWPPVVQPPDPIGDKVAEIKKVKHTPAERVEALAKLADELFVLVQKTSGNEPDKVRELAAQFKKLVEKDLFAVALEVPATE